MHIFIYLALSKKSFKKCIQCFIWKPERNMSVTIRKIKPIQKEIVKRIIPMTEKEINCSNCNNMERRHDCHTSEC